jgi:hypothetical protein
MDAPRTGGLRLRLKWLKKRARISLKLKKPRPVPTRCDVGIFVSHPKSGRTWLRVILDELDLRFKFCHDGAGGKRPFEKLPLGAKQRYATKPIVFMSRDPRDTAVSFYFERAFRKNAYFGTISDFIRDPLHGIERIVRYNLAWLERGGRLPAFLPVTYEEMSTNPFAVMRGIIDFVGARFPDCEIERVVENNTFEKMHERESRGEYDERYHSMLRRYKANEPEAHKFRRGKIGGYVDYLSVADMAYCDDLLDRYRYFDQVQQLMLSGPSPDHVIAGTITANTIASHR